MLSLPVPWVGNSQLDINHDILQASEIILELLEYKQKQQVTNKISNTNNTVFNNICLPRELCDWHVRQSRRLPVFVINLDRRVDRLAHNIISNIIYFIRIMMKFVYILILYLYYLL